MVKFFVSEYPRSPSCPATFAGQDVEQIRQQAWTYAKSRIEAGAPQVNLCAYDGKQHLRDEMVYFWPDREPLSCRDSNREG